MVGKDGSSALRSYRRKHSRQSRIVQLSGTAMTCNVDTLKNARLRSPTLLSALVRHEQTFTCRRANRPLHGCASCRGAAVPVAAQGERFGRRRYSRIYPRVPCRMLGVKRTSVTCMHAPCTGWLIKYSRVEFRSSMLRPCRKRSANATGLSNRITRP